MTPPARRITGDVDGDFHNHVRIDERDIQDVTAAPPCGFSVKFSMLTCKGPPVSSIDDRAAVFDRTRLLAERVGPGLRPPETLPFHYSVILYSGTRYHVVLAG